MERRAPRLRGDRPPPGARLTTSRPWILAAALLALLIRLALLFIRGDYIVYDEGYYLLLARSLREGHGFTLNGLPHVALSPLQPVLVAALSFLGIPDVWASRLLAASCGAALVFPVASLARRWGGERGATIAALFVALFPALLTFVPFFPGERWNLYFGSEPLFLLLATAAIAVGARAFDTGRLPLYFAAGALADLAYLARLEGIVLGFSLGAALLAGHLVLRRPRAALAILVYSAGAVVTIAYLLHLHGALGRWAISGRVQAAESVGAPLVGARPAVTAPAQGGSDAVQQFVWGGNTEVLWRTLYALDASGTRMASQYWGVPPASASVFAPTPEGPAPGRPLQVPSRFTTLFRAIAVVLPVWMVLLAIGGAVRARPSGDMAMWIGPAVVTGLAPALLAYPEPRALLILVPAVCALAALAAAWLADRLEERSGRRIGTLVTAAVALGLVIPTARDAARAWGQQTSLQQLASGRRVAGEYLGEHLPDSARIVSWHPAIAIWARRDWRVLPYDSFERIIGYAKAQGAEAVVFSRFDPSPLRDPPRAFTAVLIDATSGATGDNIRLDPVDEIPVLFVGRLATTPARP